MSARDAVFEFTSLKHVNGNSDNHFVFFVQYLPSKIQYLIFLKTQQKTLLWLGSMLLDSTWDCMWRDAGILLHDLIPAILLNILGSAHSISASPCMLPHYEGIWSYSGKEIIIKWVLVQSFFFFVFWIYTFIQLFIL